MKPEPRSFAPLSVVGLEIEYAVVDRALQPQCLVEQAFKMLKGRPTSALAFDGVGFSNELAAHVFEEKMLSPNQDLRQAESALVRGLERFQALLQKEFGARLLPTGMHPLMSPEQTHLWRRGGQAIYRAYDSLFDVRQHGWVNIQSCHVNLPFGRSERDLVVLYNAVASLLPYLPAIAASSPVVEGRAGPHLDNRLTQYRRNQSAIPCITGNIVPEFISSAKDYRNRVLRPIYAALKHVHGGELLCHEWVNSRGAILRFSRRALEIRILDVQECIRMDVALAAFTRAALRYLVGALEKEDVKLPPHATLAADLNAVIEHGGRAVVQAPHFVGPDRACVVLERIFERARAFAEPGEEPYWDLVARRIEHGSLAERILARLRTAPGRTVPEASVRDVYEELMTCLATNSPWDG